MHSLATVTVAQWSRSHCYLSYPNEKTDTYFPTSGLGQPRQLLRSSNLTKLSCRMSFQTFQSCFLHKRTMFFFFLLESGGCKLAFLCILYTQGTLETHCVPCKYCVSECQVYARCNMLLSNRLLCHMPPYCCFGCFHGKSLYRPRKEPILKAK